MNAAYIFFVSMGMIYLTEAVVVIFSNIRFDAPDFIMLMVVTSVMGAVIPVLVAIEFGK